MNLRPPDLETLQREIAAAPGGRPIGPVDLSALSRVIEHTPEDLTVTVQAGMTLAALQAHLGRARQWLPIDPPGSERLTIEEMLAWDRSGPRRCGYGTIREHLIGIKVMGAGGSVIRAGGKVVKNVAGYDLCKLFVGSRRSLGLVVEASFKLQPLPEAEKFLQKNCRHLQEAEATLQSLWESEITPMVLDLHRSAPAGRGDGNACVLVVGFAGTREEVEWQQERAASLAVALPANLDYEREFWQANGAVRTRSVLPSALTETIEKLNPAEWVARAGNGIVYYRGGEPPQNRPANVGLQERVKRAFDPDRIFPQVET